MSSCNNFPSSKIVDLELFNSRLDSHVSERPGMSRILVVDDSPIDLKLAGRILRSLSGVEVHTIDSGEKALELLQTSEFDLVVTDMRMPVVDGLLLLSRVRSQFAHIPVVLMTAEGSEDLAIQALRSGASNYVGKHEMARDLAPVCEYLLQSSRSRQARREIVEATKSGHVSFEINNDRRIASKLARHLQEAARFALRCDGAAASRVGVAIEEALLNAVIHGNLEVSSNLRHRDDRAFDELIEKHQATKPFCDRRISVDFHWSSERIDVVVRDQGVGFEVDSIPDPTDPANLLKPTGRGILLMQSFMDEVAFNDIGNEVHMTKHITTDAEVENSCEPADVSETPFVHMMGFCGV